MSSDPVRSNAFDESLLTAYLDNELEASQRELVEEQLRSSPNLRALLGELDSIRNLVRQVHAPAASADFTKGPWNMNTASATSVMPASQQPRFWGTSTSRRTWGAMLSLAALLLIALSGSWIGIDFLVKRSRPITMGSVDVKSNAKSTEPADGKDIESELVTNAAVTPNEFGRSTRSANGGEQFSFGVDRRLDSAMSEAKNEQMQSDPRSLSRAAPGSPSTTATASDIVSAGSAIADDTNQPQENMRVPAESLAMQPTVSKPAPDAGMASTRFDLGPQEDAILRNSKIESSTELHDVLSWLAKIDTQNPSDKPTEIGTRLDSYFSLLEPSTSTETQRNRLNYRVGNRSSKQLTTEGKERFAKAEANRSAGLDEKIVEFEVPRSEWPIAAKQLQRIGIPVDEQIPAEPVLQFLASQAELDVKQSSETGKLAEQARWKIQPENRTVDTMSRTQNSVGKDAALPSAMRAIRIRVRIVD